MSSRGHVSTPSLDELSSLDQPPLSPQQTNIQMELEEDHEIHIQSDQQHDVDGNEDGPSIINSPSFDPSASPASPTRIALNSDPSPRAHHRSDRCRACIRAILNFPALSVIFPLTVVLSIVQAMLNVVSAPNAFLYLADTTQPSSLPSTAGFVLSFLFTLLIAFFVLLATRQMLYQIFGGDIKVPHIIGLYVSTILLYANIYTVCLFIDVTSFQFANVPKGSSPTTNVFSVFIGMVYYSVTTITCTGFGDIVPRYGLPKIIASSELLLSIMYHIGIFSIGLEHFQNHVDDVSKGRKRFGLTHHPLVERAKETFRDLRSKYPRLDRIRKVFIAAVFPISLLIQLVFLMILDISDPDMFNKDSSTSDGIIFIFLVAQIFQFLLILLMTLTLVRQINKSYVSPGFLIQSWLATVALFAGLYTLIYLLVPGYSAFFLFDPTFQPGPYAVVTVVGQFFWLSLSAMTTTGYGDVYAVHLVARMFVSFQMLVSVCYTVVILGQALASTVGFINQIRTHRGAQLLNSAHTRVMIDAQSASSSSSKKHKKKNSVRFDDADLSHVIDAEPPAIDDDAPTDAEADEEDEVVNMSFERDVGIDTTHNTKDGAGGVRSDEEGSVSGIESEYAPSKDVSDADEDGRDRTRAFTGVHDSALAGVSSVPSSSPPVLPLPVGVPRRSATRLQQAKMTLTPAMIKEKAATFEAEQAKQRQQQQQHRRVQSKGMFDASDHESETEI